MTNTIGPMYVQKRRGRDADVVGAAVDPLKQDVKPGVVTQALGSVLVSGSM